LFNKINNNKKEKQMSTSWVSYENGVKRTYKPTTEDLNDIEDAFGKPESTTQIVARGFMDGMAGGIGYSGASGIHSAVSQTPPIDPAMSDRGIILCKSHKIHQKDLRGMENQIQASERSLAEAEMAKNQAIENYKVIFAKTLDHADGSGLGQLVTYDLKELASLKMQEQRACAEYNNRLLKFGQEKALYGHMRREYNKQNGDANPGFWISITAGTLNFFVTLFSGEF
jgi:hypothetical protein